MTCDLFEELITPFLDAELAGSDLAAFRAHQTACTECRALLADVAVAIAACADAPEVEPPLELLSPALRRPALGAAVRAGGRDRRGLLDARDRGRARAGVDLRERGARDVARLQPVDRLRVADGARDERGRADSLRRRRDVRRRQAAE